MASRSWNRVELIGNLTRDPELRFTPNGAAVCTFGIATNRTYVSDGEKKEEVDFHRLVAWNKLAELCNQLLKKGNRVFISGRLQTRSWEAQDGSTRQTTEIVVEDMIILTPKSPGESVGYGREFEDSQLQRPATQTTPEPKGEEKSEDDKDQDKNKEKDKDDEKEKDEDKKSASEQAPKEEVDDLPF